MPSENHILMHASAHVSPVMNNTVTSAQDTKLHPSSKSLSDHASSIFPSARDHPPLDVSLTLATASPQAVLVELPINNTEAILHNPHGMVEVAEEDIRSGLVPSGSVKIEVRCSGRLERSGTGTLIHDRIIVTAGHVLKDAIDAFNAPNVPEVQVVVSSPVKGSRTLTEYRNARMCVIHKGYLSADNIINDFGMILLHQKFQHVCPLGYKHTPASVNTTVAEVFGFPSEFPTSHPGQRLIKSRALVYFDPAQPQRMIEHSADTMEGHSGSPVIDVSDGLVIGVHCRWDYCIEKKLVNRAAAFGHHGNDVEIFVQILSWMEGNPRRYQEMMAGRVSGFMAQKDNRNLVVTTTGVAQKPGWLALQWS